MSSCTNTFRNLLPLCTSNVCPTNSGVIVHARAHVRIACLARFSFSFVTFLKSFSSTYGPFFELLLICSPTEYAGSMLPGYTGYTAYTFTVCGRTWCVPNLRRRRISFSLFARGERVMPPLAGTPVLLTG